MNELIKTDKIYAMSSFLQFRAGYDTNIRFSEKLGPPNMVNISDTSEKTDINDAHALLKYMEEYIATTTKDKKSALMLSGGMDSAVIARFMPEGSTAYTLKCVVPGKTVIDETEMAKNYCQYNHLKHKIIPIYWEDYEALSPALMKRKNAPIHSIEIQLYKAALQAKNDGFERLIFGNAADVVFGGLSGLLSKDYTFGEYLKRFSYVMPYEALKEFIIITEPFKKHCYDNGYIDAHSFLNDVYLKESANSYINACEAAELEAVDAYLPLEHKNIDFEKIRNGKSKYIIRRAFEICYPALHVPEKIPMARAMNEWFETWDGPKRLEFWTNCHVNMTGDQKYYIWILEKFLDIMGI